MKLHIIDEAERCLKCKKPLCQQGCPIHTPIPQITQLLLENRLMEAGEILFANNPMSAVCSTVCNHENQCEGHCVLGRKSSPIHFSSIENFISDSYLDRMEVPKIEKNGKKVAVIGAGPAGLVVANQLNLKGYSVTLFDKNEAPGGLLRFGIPNFKLDKNVIDRRMNILTAEGIKFEMGVEIDVNHLPEGFDAYCICTGTPAARDLSIPGRDLKGIYFALEMLAQQNRILEGQTFSKDKLVNAKGKKVLVIGGGDTGSDCIGTSVRQGATSVTQIEIMPQPPVGQNPATPWPMYPQVLKTSSSHEEGCIRRWNLASNRFIGEKNNLIGVEVEEVEWAPSPDGGRPQMRQTGKKEIIEADLVFLAMGFLHPEQEGLIKELRLATDNRDNIAVDNAGYTANSNLFACGDAVSGASLVVKAMASGRNVARSIDRFLQTN